MLSHWQLYKPIIRIYTIRRVEHPLCWNNCVNCVLHLDYDLRTTYDTSMSGNGFIWFDLFILCDIIFRVWSATMQLVQLRYPIISLDLVISVCICSCQLFGYTQVSLDLFISCLVILSVFLTTFAPVQFDSRHTFHFSTS